MSKTRQTQKFDLGIPPASDVATGTTARFEAMAKQARVPFFDGTIPGCVLLPVNLADELVEYIAELESQLAAARSPRFAPEGSGTSADDLFMALSEIASAKDIEEFGPNPPMTRRGVANVTLTMNEILLALGKLQDRATEPTEGSALPPASPLSGEATAEPTEEGNG